MTQNVKEQAHVPAPTAQAITEQGSTPAETREEQATREKREKDAPWLAEDFQKQVRDAGFPTSFAGDEAFYQAAYKLMHPAKETHKTH